MTEAAARAPWPRGAEYDAIDAITIDLGGTLDVDRLGLFGPQLNDCFDVMEVVGFIDGFTSFDLPAVAAGLTWQHFIVDPGNGDRTYRLLAAASSVPGPSAPALLGLAALLVRFGARRRPMTAN